MFGNRVSTNLFFSWVVLFISLFIIFSSFASDVFAEVGDPNATVSSSLEIANTAPEVANVSFEGGGSIALNPSTTKIVSCVVVVQDFDGEGDIQFVNATIFDYASAVWNSSDDNNSHYENSSCAINLSYGTFNGYADDEYRGLANCTFEVEYYANPGTWTCNASVYDQSNASGWSHNNATMAQLLAVGLPDTIDYGLVNATAVSTENQTNVTNFGNTVINVSLEGYGKVKGDGNAMNCSLGALENISVEHEKFNLTNSSPGDITLAQTTVNYTNLTTSPSIRFFNLSARTNDSVNDIWQATYWRIYVPVGVAGNCTGNVVFGATTANGV